VDEVTGLFIKTVSVNTASADSNEPSDTLHDTVYVPALSFDSESSLTLTVNLVEEVCVNVR